MKRKQPLQDLCPMCGQGTTHVERLDYKIKDEDGAEFIVPQLEVEICDFCGEHIFNMAAVRKARAAQGNTGKIFLRLQPTLQNALAARARSNKRSLAQEAQHLLEASLGAN